MNVRALAVRAFRFFVRTPDSREEGRTPPTRTPPTATTETLWPLPDADTMTLTEQPPAITGTPDDEAAETILTVESTITGDMTTRTDSGHTITVPNDEIITITRHTTVVTGRPPPLPTWSEPEYTWSMTESGEATSSTSPSPTPEGTESAQNPDNLVGTSTLPVGAIVGIAVGGAALIAFLVIVMFVTKRRAKNRREAQQAAAMEDDIGRDDLVEEKHFPNPMSAHTTGTQGSVDPFAPFGDVSDSEYPNRPPSNVFEMDATSAAPVELPAMSTADDAPGKSPEMPSGARQGPWIEPGSAAPQTSLNSLGQESGRPKYINQWDQYKAMGPN